MSYRINEYTDDEWATLRDKPVQEFIDSYESNRQHLEDELNKPDFYDSIEDETYAHMKTYEIEKQRQERLREEMRKIQNAWWWKPWTWHHYFTTSVRKDKQ